MFGGAGGFGADLLPTSVESKLTALSLVDVWVRRNSAVLTFDLRSPQHVVFVVKFFVAWMIPDVPSEVKARIKRERYLIQEYLHNYELEKLKVQLSQSNGCCAPPDSGCVSTITDRHEVLSECL